MSVIQRKSRRQRFCTFNQFPIAMPTILVLTLLAGVLFQADSSPTRQIDQLKKLGARITLDDEGRIVGVNLSERKVTNDDLQHLKGLEHLQELDLTRTRITSAGLVHLKDLTNLKRLYLTDTKVDDMGMVHLQGLKNLTFAGLSGTKITDAALDDLRELKGLKKIFCLGTGVTDAGVEKLRQSMPGCEVTY
jgi:hypothetical protein